MARDGSGSYSLPEAPFVYDTVISETAVNNNFSDIASALTQSMSKDGQTTPTANLPMGTYRHTGVGNATARTDYAAAGQVQDSAFTWCSVGGTSDAITLTPTPAITSYVTGQEFRFIATSTNTGATTIAVSGLTAKAAQNDGAALAAGDITSGKLYTATYDGTQFQIERVRVSQLVGDILTTQGDILYRNASGVTRLAAGTSGQVLQTGGAGANPAWADIQTGTATVTAGEDLANRDLIYQDVFNQRGAGVTKWYKVDADATGPVNISPRIGIALAAITSGNSGTAQVGAGSVGSFIGLTEGLPVYASGTSGGLTQTTPAVPSSGTQNASRLVGFATSTTAIWFDPTQATVFQYRNSALASGSSVTVEHWSDSGARDRIPAAYIAASGSGIRITTGTPTAPLGGTAANFNDNNTSTVCTSSGLGALTGLPVASRIMAKIDYGSNQSLTKIEAINVYLSSSSTAAQIGLFYSTDGSSWTQAGSLVTPTTTPQTLTATGSFTARYIGLTAAPDGWGSITQSVADLNGYTAGAAHDEPLTIGSETVNGSATDRVTVKFSDTSEANQDTMTTFFNRTNATRDLIVEVTL